MVRYCFTYSRKVCGKDYEFQRQFHSKKEYDEDGIAKIVRKQWGKDARLVSWRKETLIKTEV